MVQKERLKIGIVFSYDALWLGGVYYIKSIIKSLDSLEEEKKPEIILFVKSESESFINDLDYKYLSVQTYKPVNKYLGYLYSWLLRKNFYTDFIIEQNDLDGLFPITDMPIKGKLSKTKIISWYPDLQHKFYPKYFSKFNLVVRDLRIKFLLKNAQGLVVSSKDVLSHFQKFYTIQPNFKFYTLPFVSNIQKSKLDINSVKSEYKIEGKYFIVCNQFYEHKNHSLVFAAISELLKKGIKTQVIFTGKFEDYKNPNYIKYLQKFIEAHDISNCIKIIGIIPRDKQICLMQNSIAVIQPSLFEGWSTVVEDAKTLQAPIITSNIPVHFEQLGDKGFYFESSNAQSLADLMLQFMQNTQGQIAYFDDYDAREKIFATQFIEIFSK